MLFSISANSQQNLVVNGDFEEYSECPTGFSDPSQNPKEIEKCIGWKAPTYGTSDYYNVCASNPNVSVPTNLFGEQPSFNGNGYVGGYFTNYNYGAGTDGYSGIMWWEYIQGRLVNSLEQGKVYRFSMEVSLAEGSDLVINEMGAFFSKDAVSSPNTSSLNVSPQCVFNDLNYFQDTVNWVHLETYFMASGGEQFLTIGNFKDNFTSDTLRRFDISPININPFITYFYIDHVVLIDYSSELTVANGFTPNGDGINDQWKLPFSGEIGQKKVSILNRWGNLIKEGDLNGFTWDGKTENGSECTDGTYFYRISNTNIAGFIELIR